ncbi:MAG: TlpA family protein disulfide reductase, partial [Candidatus Eiseniibacteriota bacterium]
MSLQPQRSSRRSSAGSGVAITAVLLAMLSSAPASAGGPTAERVQEALQHHVFRTPSGGSFTVASLSGQVVVLHLWATWCAPCRKELPKLDALNTELAQHGGQVLAVSIDLVPRNVERFMSQQKLKLPVSVDGPDGLAHELDVPAIPYT